jgi:hypothetical protein
VQLTSVLAVLAWGGIARRDKVAGAIEFLRCASHRKSFVVNE